MKKYQSEKLDQTIKIQKGFLMFLYLVVFVLFGVQIVVSNLLASSGDKIQLLSQRHDSLISQNENIKQQISIIGSLNNLKASAEKMGFVKNTSVVYIDKMVNVALSR